MRIGWLIDGEDGSVPQRLTLQFLTPPLAGRQVVLTGPEHSVGRARHHAICLPVSSVSTNHARLYLEGDAWLVMDQGSTNGTYLNEVRLGSAPVKLDVGGGLLTFANIECRFRLQPLTYDIPATQAVTRSSLEVSVRPPPAPVEPPRPASWSSLPTGAPPPPPLSATFPSLTPMMPGLPVARPAPAIVPRTDSSHPAVPVLPPTGQAPAGQAAVGPGAGVAGPVSPIVEVPAPAAPPATRTAAPMPEAVADIAPTLVSGLEAAMLSAELEASAPAAPALRSTIAPPGMRLSTVPGLALPPMSAADRGPDTAESLISLSQLEGNRPPPPPIDEDDEEVEAIAERTAWTRDALDEAAREESPTASIRMNQTQEQLRDAVRRIHRLEDEKAALQEELAQLRHRLAANPPPPQPVPDRTAEERLQGLVAQALPFLERVVSALWAVESQLGKDETTLKSRSRVLDARLALADLRSLLEEGRR